jgi:glycosyltransferase involved in cell wall biosynthesis
MRILMLGWEFPPFIAGGLGVACYGLTKALDRKGHEVLFILPRPVDKSHSSHIKLLSPDSSRGPLRLPKRASRTGAARRAKEAVGGFDPDYTTTEFEHAVFKGVNAAFSSPYPLFNTAEGSGLEAGADPSILAQSAEELGDAPPPIPVGIAQRGGGHYSGDLVGDADRYARLVVALAHTERFDVIHAHDWLTYPAGIAIAGVTGKPLIVHVHSTEFDRSGDNIHQQLYDIERRGMHMANRVVAVSAYTKSICVQRYGISPPKVDVVYNGIDRDTEQPAPGSQIESKDKIVLFLGRITMQKGPEYFIAAAKRVLEKIGEVKFVVAGSGDMTTRMIELAAQMGIGSKVLFTGFLRGRDVERVFSMADCYVMPSVSEPFGISALEAIHHDVPVIISKQSGVSEVLTHVLKVDFWDTNEMANKIVAVLRHPPLSQTLRHHGSFDLRQLTWDGAADKCVRAYGQAINEHKTAKRA